MNTYTTSSGERVTKAYIDRMVKKAKKEVLQDQIDEKGYNFCTICKMNSCVPIDCMHIISVDQCQKTGMAEYAWDKKNIVPAGRDCHKRHDNVELKFRNHGNKH